MQSIDMDRVFEKTNLKWLKGNTIYASLFGSHAYGTSRPESDIDIRGVAISPFDCYFSMDMKFDQAEFSEPYDCVIFDLVKFCKLAAECNPSVIEILFTNDDCHLIKTKTFQKFLDIRHQFLSKKARYSFSGYAISQLKRIKLHRKYILNPPTKKPERSDYNLPDNKKLIPEEKMREIEAGINKIITSWNPDTTGMENHTSIKFKNELQNVLTDLSINTEKYEEYAIKQIGLDDNLTDMFKRESLYRKAKKEWNNYLEWESYRNKERYEMEVKYHMDLKHAMHLVRLFKECLEILETGNLTVRRSKEEIELLISIRNGAWSYDDLIQFAEDSDKQIGELYEKSTIRHAPDRSLINSVLKETIIEFLHA